MKEIIFPEKKEIKGPPNIKKNGIIYPCGSEMSVFVHNGMLKYLVNHWQDFANNKGAPVTLSFAHLPRRKAAA